MLVENTARRDGATEFWYAYCCAYLLRGLALGEWNNASLVGVVLVVL